MPQLQSFLNQTFALGADFLPFIVLIVLALLFSLYFGRDRFAPLIAALYAAMALYMAFPYALSFLESPYMKILFYGVLAALAFVAFSGLSYFMARNSGEFFSQLVLSILAAGLLLAILMHVLSAGQIYAFSPSTRSLFSSGQSFFFWLAAPLVGLFFLSR